MARKYESLVSKVKAIDRNSAAHTPRPARKDRLSGIYRNLQSLICARMKTAQIRTATTNRITIMKFILEAQTLNGLSLRVLEKPMPLVAEIWLS
jgi:hypothetical protein